ncbi:dihydroorotate dehydrogenase-like protein [Leptolinea tardivitalis]|uniref:Dihydroorotate dehydrogenase n=1 Tax=Leptolinea tardivitalis TaxID=229920 RepID=A0A0N8GKU3_9CHLR|nr:dihydroorotate dehydrogenase-like protein [Leptolinea tardivitalis]KPL70658.1 dihydroorotate dehydrogenase [Leptolinea tardivitalis]GAP22287.1 dihydroorotate dehydrogenase [Leptolinea tardivitalis]
MIDLTTQYLGLELNNPLIASSSPLSKKADTVKKMEDAGISAVVMYSLFEEQITHESLALNYFLERGTHSFAEAATFFPDLDHYNVGPEEYLSLIQKIKSSVSIPVIGSLNGISNAGWVRYARNIEQAGADALELNMYHIPTDVDLAGRDLEKDYIDLVKEIRKQVRIPLAVKISPFFTSIPYMAGKFVQSGANGLVMFNRFFQPDFDIDTLDVVPTLQLSTSNDLRLPLRWTAILYGRIKADLAITGGVHTVEDVIKSIMAGASSVMLASEILEKGTRRITELNSQLLDWFEKNEYQSVRQMRGSMSQQNVSDPAAFERGNYMKALTSFDNRILV